MVKVQEIVRPDGDVWYKTHKYCADLLITSKGNDLLSKDPKIENDVELYIKLALIENKKGGSQVLNNGIRSYFSEDTNGIVYNLNQRKYGNDLLVKETNGHSMNDALYRLDRIKQIIDKRRSEGRFPLWIDVPDHYGLVTGKSLPSQFVIMQGIDAGINVRDVIKDFDSFSGIERQGVTSSLGNIDTKVIDEIRVGYELTGHILTEAIAEETQQVPTKLLSDWHEGNVVLERLVEPLEGSNFRYWVIDQ